jgi:uncharacterized protein YunC (DUF1805 family)
MPLQYEQIRLGKKRIEAVLIRLQAKNFILLRGRHGYVMCGYLNLNTARKFSDVAVKVTGISTVKEALKAKVHSCSPCAKRLGIRRGDAVKKVLELIA